MTEILLRYYLHPKYVIFKENNSLSVHNEKVDSLKYRDTDTLNITNQYHIFKWNRNEYLLSNQSKRIVKKTINDYDNFSKYYNEGLEPEKSGDYLRLVKDKNVQYEKFDVNKIPKEYQKLFIVNPIQASILNIQSLERDTSNLEPWESRDVKLWRIKIDKGESDRIVKSMRFKSEDGNFSISIDSIENNYSFGIAYAYDFQELDKKININTVLKTRWR